MGSLGADSVPTSVQIRALQRAIVATPGCTNQLPRHGVDGIFGIETEEGVECLAKQWGGMNVVLAAFPFVEFYIGSDVTPSAVPADVPGIIGTLFPGVTVPTTLPEAVPLIEDIVRLPAVTPPAAPPATLPARKPEEPFYTQPWFFIALAVGVPVAALVAYALKKPEEKITEAEIEEIAENRGNPLPPWPGIGPCPHPWLGPAFWLGQSVLW
jgi:hypothetical protein